MTEQVTAVRRGMVPHHGPISAQCPVQCLLTVLSMSSLLPLARAWPPLTVGGVLELQAAGRLAEVDRIGRRRLGEIETALVFAGLPLGGGPQEPASAEGLPR